MQAIKQEFDSQVKQCDEPSLLHKSVWSKPWRAGNFCAALEHFKLKKHDLVCQDYSKSDLKRGLKHKK